MRIVGITDLVCDVYYDENLNIIGAFGGMSTCNIICNLQYMGFNTYVYGSCGNDYLGKICIDSLNDCNVENDIKRINNLNTKAYHILKRKEDNRDVFRSIKYCPFCKEKSWYENSYIDYLDILNKLKKDDILVFDNLNDNIQYIVDNTKNIKLIDLGTYNEFDNLNKNEIINKISNKFTIVNLNERVEKYLINRLDCSDTIELSKIINADLMMVTRGKKGNDFIYNNKKYSFPLENIIEEVDDSGAGDAFFSVIIKNWLNNRMIIDPQLFDEWFKDTKELVEIVLKLIGSRAYIKPLYTINKELICNA